MASQPTDVSSFVTALLPSLSRSLAEQFNVFRVMHHGTHEKQLSNVFSWLLTPEATHELGDAFQRLFLDCVNQGLPGDAQLPTTGYRVTQEVDTRGDEELAGGEVGMDIADVLLTRDDAAVIIENYGTSDGHGHDFHRYRDHAAALGRDAAVVLLCLRREEHLQRDGWEDAVVVTYAEVLSRLDEHIAANPSWARTHPEQHFFIQQMLQHFVEGPAAVNLDDQIAFIKAMCSTGESDRYGQSHHESAAQEFADLVAAHAGRQFEESRRALDDAKASLRNFARTTLRDQVNDLVGDGPVGEIDSNFRGIWKWGIRLSRPEGYQNVFLVVGPTAAHVMSPVADNDFEPDFARVFVTFDAASVATSEDVVQTDVGLDEVINGLPREDVRLRDAVLALVGSGS